VIRDPLDAVKPLTGAAPLPRGTFSAAELQRMEFPPIRWIVPDVLPEGLTILGGKPKLGKSWLALDMALAVATGGNVLGRECEPGPVLYLALEDNHRRLQRRLQRLQPRFDWPTVLELGTRWPRLDAGGEKQLRAWIAAREGARLAILDTLATIRPAARAADSAHASDYAALHGLHQIASDTGVAVLVIHHLRKADADDPFDSVSGSTGLTGAADSTLILTRREGDGGCILYGRGRDLEEFEIAMEFDKATCRWRDLGDAMPVACDDERPMPDARGQVSGRSDR
jgi:RecA-family ATPase